MSKKASQADKSAEEAVQGGPLTTGLTDLDELVGSYRPGELVVVGSRPGVGKSAFGMNLLLHALELRRPALLASADVPAGEYLSRLACCAARVDSHKARAGTLLADGQAKLAEARARLEDGLLQIDDRPRQPVARIAGRLAGLGPAAVLLVDSLQGLEPRQRSESLYEEMGRIVRDLKYLARDANVPAILLAGLRRPSEDRRDRRPQLTDLAQTAALEEAADVVLLLHRPDVYEPGQHEGIMEVIVPKRRGGPTGDVTLAFIKQSGRLEDFRVGTPFDG
jgi:replicative DNA helicase